jgi:hypothetical protein
MQYVCLIYSPEAVDENVTPEQWQQVMDEYNAFTKHITDRGINKGGEALQPTKTATTVRIRDGKTVVTDGPFAETKEQLGGYYLIDCKDLDEAIEVAARIPGAKWGSIEVRPIIDFSQPQ